VCKGHAGCETKELNQAAISAWVVALKRSTDKLYLHISWMESCYEWYRSCIEISNEHLRMEDSNLNKMNLYV
jgi:hypothetical protein